MTKRIYMVEDEKSLNLLLKKYLENEGYQVTTFFDGKSAVEKIEEMPDLWILDIMLPDTDGYQLIKKIKSFNPDTAVIFISARNEELDRVVGLELGSEDYLPKPFLPRELVIRTNRLLERMNKKEKSEENECESIEGYKIDKKQRAVSFENIEIQFTTKEFELLCYFVSNKNIVVTRDQILDSVWGKDYFGSDRVVDDTVRRLRKKLERINLETLYGYGYKLVVR